MNLTVIGAGYVGLVTAAVFAQKGHNVTCVESDPGRLELLRAGKAPFFEQGLTELLTETTASGNLVATNDISSATRNADIVFIAVGTPSDAAGKADMSQIINAVQMLAPSINGFTVIVNKSTVPIHGAETVKQVLISCGVSEGEFAVVSNPEFLREGSAIFDTTHPDRIVLGGDNPVALQKMQELYQDFGAPIIVTDANSAELIKYGSNCFLAAKISFINAMSRICELCNADIADVAQGMGADKRIGPSFLSAGLGWGGSCFPKDVKALYASAKDMGYNFELIKEIERINDDQPANLLQRIEKRLGGLDGKTVAMLGLAFKPNTDDIREARSLILIKELLTSGARVRAHDPQCMDQVAKLFSNVTYADSVEECVQLSDTTILVTEWAEYRTLDFTALKRLVNQPILFDGRRLFGQSELEAAGWEYHTVGNRC
jgi:UDPglucose 6-dehydrogenase